MASSGTVGDSMNSTKTCVVIPTYNNDKTLRRVIEGVLNYTSSIIIVNDGSTDGTKDILNTYPDLAQLHLYPNSGKGNALRQGFKMARKLGYDFAITIDSDGQHFPDDIPVFMEALENEGNNVLLVGNRDMNREGIPGGSSFGNKFSNFWFWFETGISLQDTQSGYRLYPLERIPKKYYTQKFEFEIEILVRSAWKGIDVKNIPVKVLYDPSERVSHFRPFKDFARISVLNTVLVVISLIYIKPRDFSRNFKKKSLSRFIKEDILEVEDSNSKKAASIGLGIFVGISPFWGFQTAIVIFLAVVLNWNKALAFLFSNISIPPMIPVIIFASLQTGALFVPGSTTDLSEYESAFEFIKTNLFQYLVGSFILATVTAIVFGVISYFLLLHFGKTSKLKV